MARILAISSYVSYGHVGLSAIIPALQAMGHEVLGVPTVVLSSHYGYRTVSGFRLDARQTDSILEAMAANGWLQKVDAVMTGYMPSVGVVAGVARVLGGLSQDNPDVIYLCDPVMGDDPRGLYIGDEVAAAIRDLLVPLADVVTPNRFELAWLTGETVNNPCDADVAANLLGTQFVTVTSVPAAGGAIANVLSDQSSAVQFAAPLLANVPHGTGDLFAALLLGHIVSGESNADAVARASSGVQACISGSAGAGELKLVETLNDAVNAAPAYGLAVASPVTTKT